MNGARTRTNCVCGTRPFAMVTSTIWTRDWCALLTGHWKTISPSALITVCWIRRMAEDDLAVALQWSRGFSSCCRYHTLWPDQYWQSRRPCRTRNDDWKIVEITSRNVHNKSRYIVRMNRWIARQKIEKKRILSKMLHNGPNE